MRVLVTGASGRLARVLLPRLCAEEGIEAVVGVDMREAVFSHARYTHHRLDLRIADANALVRDCEALVHLAFVVLRGRMSEGEMAAMNLHASQRLIAAAVAAGVHRIVHLSSAAVYGAGEALAEDAPLAPLPGFLYAAHKAVLEAWLATHAPFAVRLRPHVILGPFCQPLFKTLLKSPFHIPLPAPAPRLQCVHELDVAEAVVCALNSEVCGPFNLAADPPFTLAEVLSGPLPLPLPLARMVLTAAWRLTGFGGEPAWIEGVGFPLTLDCRRAARLLGWRPRFDTRASLAAARAAIIAP